MTNLEKLKFIYFKNLALCRAKHPDDYAWPDSELENVIRRMSSAIDKMSFNKDSHAWKLTCKELGIKHTYQAIKQYIEGV